MKKNVSFGNFAILASGTGTNALALIETARESSFLPSFVLVNKKESPLVDSVPLLNIPCECIETKTKGVDEEFEKKALELCQKYEVKWLLLAGFLKILSAEFVNSFKNVEGVSQILNIHPSLLPKYPGLGGYKKAWQNEDQFLGHTIHLVTPELDSGPILLQKEFRREGYESLSECIEENKKQENQSYQSVLKLLMEKGLTLSDGVISLGD